MPFFKEGSWLVLHKRSPQASELVLFSLDEWTLPYNIFMVCDSTHMCVDAHIYLHDVFFLTLADEPSTGDLTEME